MATRHAAAEQPKPPVGPPGTNGAIPSPNQIAWQEREFIGFLHFGVNTFTDREWGEGHEDEKLFNPVALDAKQWVKVAKEAGMKMLILTAKHHDGFCLWPSKVTQHSVVRSPWKGGKGDVVKELADACREGGIDVGLYLSPWDRTEATYGDSPAYNKFYLTQIAELTKDYGKISEFWFDGACGEGPNGKKQIYDFPAYWNAVRSNQPTVCLFSDAGPDVRWVGNEKGFAADPNWAMVNLAGMTIGGNNKDQTHGLEGGANWCPTECDVSIRPGWFYHAAESLKLKTLKELVEIYYNSVGLNGVMLLNVPPDRRGLIHENDAARLREFRAAIDAIFKDDLARGHPATATNTRGNLPAYAPAMAVDGDKKTYWATDEDVTAASMEVDLGGPKKINRAVFQEAIALGQRVKSFRVEVHDGISWMEVARGETIGYKRIVRFPEVTASKVRLKIVQSRACLVISNFGVYYASPAVDPTEAK